ncbi:DUF3795 domain-containing protein [Candidatus Bipolaricaulota bacterium]
MLGYCGIDCAACPAYRGTVTTNPELLEKAAGEYEAGAFSAEEWVCLGCTPADQGFLATYCAKCKIRACAVEKGVQNCAACDEYDSCSKMQAFLETEPESVTQRMTWLRERFLSVPGRSRS